MMKLDEAKHILNNAGYICEAHTSLKYDINELADAIGGMLELNDLEIGEKQNTGRIWQIEYSDSSYDLRLYAAYFTENDQLKIFFNYSSKYFKFDDFTKNFKWKPNLSGEKPKMTPKLEAWFDEVTTEFYNQIGY